MRNMLDAAVGTEERATIVFSSMAPGVLAAAGNARASESGAKTGVQRDPVCDLLSCVPTSADRPLGAARRGPAGARGRALRRAGDRGRPAERPRNPRQGE